MEPLIIEIQTDDRTLSMPFDGGTKRGTEVLPGVVYDGLVIRKGGDILSDALRFIVDVSVGLEVNLLAAYLYDKVRSRADTRLVIRRRVVEQTTRDGIERVIEEEIRGPYNKD